jgi:hypothetical protein
MTLLEQCQIWHENDEHQKIVEALEAVGEPERTPEMDLELARAYNNIADPEKVEGRKLLRKALDLLKRHEERFQNDYSWNFRMGYACYYLDWEGAALKYLERAQELHPGDSPNLNSAAEIQELIDGCRHRLALPRFEKSFRERTAEAWAAFQGEEAELRRLMDREDRNAVADELLAKCGDALQLAFEDVSFELGFNGEKYELILTPEGNKARLFQLVYFCRHAPASLGERWNILTGRQPSRGFKLGRDGWEVSAEEVQVWVEKDGEQSVGLTLYCEKLLPLLREDKGKAWWMLSTLTDQVLGEIPAMALISDFDVADNPGEGTGITLEKLPEALERMGFSLDLDAEKYLENSYLGYEMKPDEDPDADWRLDVFAGSSNCPSLINEYLENESDTMDTYHQDGVTAGFFCYPLEGFDGPERGKKVLEFRDALETAVQQRAGDETVTFLGGASGLFCGYLDFIAWDLGPVLSAAAEFFRESPLEWANFHVFRRNVGAVRLLARENREEPGETSSGEPPEEQAGSLLSRKDIETLESFEDGASGYFGRMLEYLENFIGDGVAQGRFTEKQAGEDLQIALWYAFACNNLDRYEYYDKAVRWMQSSEKNARGSGTWYYRYSVALMYCGRLEEAFHYAEAGAREEPDYPWIWLQAGKLRSHFGDNAGALEAVKQGLALVPGDHEFLTLEQEIREGASLERMEYHWIDPESDRRLQEGLDEDADDKQRSISCITVNQEGLDAFQALFHLGPEDWKRNAPYCSFRYPARGHDVELVFRMNEAGLSKMKLDWVRSQKEHLDAGDWLTHLDEDGRTGTLDTVVLGLDYRVGLLYRIPGTQRYFQVVLEQDGTPAEAPGASEAGKENREGEAEGAKEETGNGGSFVGFVLLSRAAWDKEQLIRDLKKEWDLDVWEDNGDTDDTLVFSEGEMIAAVSLMPAPVPGGEAEQNAENNYMWPEAVKKAQEHKAHLMVAVLGKDVGLLERGKLFVKIVACCCKQKNATGVYTSGTVFEPHFYESFAGMMKEDELPIFNWIWFGLYRSGEKVCGYTYGMEAFGKQEMEILDADAQPSQVRDFLASLVSYVLEYDVTLKDGETIGFSQEDKHSITCSEGVSLPGMTLKISYGQVDGKSGGEGKV